MIVIDVEPDANGERNIVFRTVDGFTPPEVEMAEVGGDS
jgi:hypothetical protein